MLSRSIFYIVFFLSFLVGGFFYQFGILPYRMVFLAFLVIPIVIFHPIKADRVFWFMIILIGISVLSGILNGSSFFEWILFTRLIVIPYAMYRFTQIIIKKEDIVSLLKLCVFIGLIQLPIVIIQITFSEIIRELSEPIIAEFDIAFGTFYVSNDVGMCFYLNCLIIYLLFERENNQFYKYRFYLSLYLTITIFLSNSVISQIAVTIIWATYALPLIRRLNIAKVIVCSGIIFFFLFNLAWDEFNLKSLNQNIEDYYEIEFTNEDLFLEGGYARGAGILYYLKTFPNYVGDGPSKYYDPIKQEYNRGITGFLLTYYSEIGLFGLITGYILLYSMIGQDEKFTPPFKKIIFIVLCITSIASPITADIGIMLTYSIFMRISIFQRSTVNIS